MSRTHAEFDEESENTMKDTFDVIMAGYQSLEPAQKNFEAFVQLIKGKQVRSEGVILVEHDVDGKVRVTQTGDHMGRKGMGWGGGVGLVVGLFSPPLLASIVVGAARQPFCRRERFQKAFIRRVRIQARQHRVEVGARLILRIDGVAKSDRRDLHLQATDIDALFRLDQIDDATVGTHLEAIQSARFDEHRMLGESPEHRVDHLLRTEWLSTADAGEDLRFVENARRLGGRRDIELRDQRNRAFGAGLHADAALHALRFDEAKLRRERIVEDRAFGTCADTSEAHRARIAIDRDGAKRRARRQRNRLPRHRRVRSKMVNGE